MAINPDQIKSQSLNAYNQWKDQWRTHAKEHSRFAMKPFSDFLNTGIGKAALCVANGASFEKELEVIKSQQGNVDIVACDKTLGHLLDNGITPAYAVVCDANVNYEKYMEKWKDKLANTILFINVCGNPQWTRNGNWKDVYFFANTDVLGSEKEFMELSGCPNQIAAGTNVSNAMVIALTQCDNSGRKNYFGYDKILLIGFDYSWMPDGNYYSFDKDGSGKYQYMRHLYLPNINGKIAYTSTNLAFSAQWLAEYIKAFKLPIVQCSKDSILPTKKMGVLSKQMEYSFNREDKDKVKKITDAVRKLRGALSELEGQMNAIGKDHYLAYLASV